MAVLGIKNKNSKNKGVIDAKGKTSIFYKR